VPPRLIHTLVLCLSAVLPIVSGCARPGTVRPLAELQGAPLYTFTEQELDVFLRAIAPAGGTFEQRVATLARKNLGQPYRLSLLGEYPYELYDADPMVCLEASDCVTFVEQTYAMALAHDWPTFFRTLQHIRYKNGVVGMLTRNHFTAADWNINNAWLFDDITDALADDAARPMRVSVDRAAFFEKYGIGQDIPVQAFRGTFIHRSDLPRVAGQLRTADVVEFVRGSEQSQYVGHVGLIMAYGADGVMLIHASEPAVREEPLVEYVHQHPKIIGVKILRLLPPLAGLRWDSAWPADLQAIPPAEPGAGGKINPSPPE